MIHSTPPETLRELVTLLRTMINKPGDRPTPKQLAASIRRLFPEREQTLDAAGLTAWCVMGVWLFSEPPSSAEGQRKEIERLMMGMGMLRMGNLSEAAKILRTSRRTLRAQLRYLGIRPEPHVPSDEPSDEPSEEPSAEPHGTRPLGPFPSVEAPQFVVAIVLGMMGMVLGRAEVLLGFGLTPDEAIARALNEYPMLSHVEAACYVVWSTMLLPAEQAMDPQAQTGPVPEGPGTAFSTAVMMVPLALVLGRAELAFTMGADPSTAIDRACLDHPVAPGIETVCRAVWDIAVRPTGAGTQSGGPHVH